MLAFQASPDTPDGIACSSALNAARQICYWSSLFMTMMDERNVVYPITTMPSSTSEPSMSSTLSSSSSSASVLSSMILQHHPVILIIKCSNVICTTRSPSLFLISSAVSKFSYRSSASHLRFFAVWAEFLSLFYSFLQCFLQCLHRTIHYYHPCPLHYLDNSQQCIHSVVNLLFPHPPVCNLSFLFTLNLSVTSAPIQVTPSFFQQVSSFSSEQKPPSLFACTPAVHSSLPTACPPVHQHYPSPVSRQLPLCQPSSSSMSLSLSSTTVNQPPRGQSTMPPPSSLMVVDPAYGFPGQFCTVWLHTLKIPKNVEILDQVKEIWEVGGPSCPPLKYWTVLMRNYNSSEGQNTSMYSQRKLIYTLFRHQWDMPPCPC